MRCEMPALEISGRLKGFVIMKPYRAQRGLENVWNSTVELLGMTEKIGNKRLLLKNKRVIE
jgi:hypothetical protein